MVPVSLDLDLTHAALLLLQTNYSERIELKVSDGKNAPGCAVRLSLDHMKEEGTITLYTLDTREWEMLTLYRMELVSNHDLERIRVHTGKDSVKSSSIESFAGNGMTFESYNASSNLQNELWHFVRQLSPRDIIADSGGKTVYKCTHAGTRYALKKSKNDNPVDEPTQEVCNLVRMRKRKNNLQFFAAWIEFKQAESRYRKDIHSVCILTELLSRSLDDILESENMTDRTRANFIFKQIVLGVDEIHKEGFIHRDLKPANIAINDDSLEISIIDFETACKKPMEGELVFDAEPVGTEGYCDPVLTMNILVGYNELVDIFSLGIIYFLLGIKDASKRRKSHKQLLKSLRYSHMGKNPTSALANRELFAQWPGNVALLLEMLRSDFKNRPTAQDILSILAETNENAETTDNL
ncbi:hypothetical protein BDA96_04G255600 [Sorghum bicolor]|uniref:non-specific serine/threonine protein kinase n=2 Tax=Sorghum bicolor TaxID=4558 RepID=A0A194YRF8_SORBI|nr:mitogen-activated protein kinase 14-like [Sorghum bicolor]KAG0534162.1 hypothetical protein BDA96_04G255600 [Sorghum bicolor]KXG30776.1 hypothetical protein SORBI_3004G240100 [Sorghum bicolor]KXG30777.1 hypothetical protein SORBI_3004G240100 [Sorghum bicolor]|eukprot:XP_021314639.1 mitogen-activated protein kinase 14-like [Sorghum bicolor]